MSKFIWVMILILLVIPLDLYAQFYFGFNFSKTAFSFDNPNFNKFNPTGNTYGFLTGYRMPDMAIELFAEKYSLSKRFDHSGETFDYKLKATVFGFGLRAPLAVSQAINFKVGLAFHMLEASHSHQNEEVWNSFTNQIVDNINGTQGAIYFGLGFMATMVPVVQPYIDGVIHKFVSYSLYELEIGLLFVF